MDRGCTGSPPRPGGKLRSTRASPGLARASGCQWPGPPGRRVATAASEAAGVPLPLRRDSDSESRAPAPHHPEPRPGPKPPRRTPDLRSRGPLKARSAVPNPDRSRVHSNSRLHTGLGLAVGWHRGFRFGAWVSAPNRLVKFDLRCAPRCPAAIRTSQAVVARGSGNHVA